MMASELLDTLVSQYNTGVRTRDFTGFLALLSDDAVLDFEGVPERGALVGKAQIAQHLHDDPPDDRIRINRWKREGNALVAEFAWADIPEGGGCLYLEPRDERVARLTIAFGGPRGRFR
jgi:hypothetical protein